MTLLSQLSSVHSVSPCVMGDKSFREMMPVIEIFVASSMIVQYLINSSSNFHRDIISARMLLEQKYSANVSVSSFEFSASSYSALSVIR